MNGVLNIDKPAGMTSHDVVARVRRIAKIKRVGHAGTLDPDATGVLLVCLGSATRISDYLADEGKEYQATLVLGAATTTEDASGEVVTEADASEVTEQDLCELLPRFLGTIMQTPPMVSAVHHEGKRLYALARAGVIVERAARPVRIDSIDLGPFKSGRRAHATLTVACGKGTYIRTLCADIGAALGVGGHMSALRRTRVGTFTLETAVPLDMLADADIAALLTPPSQALASLPAQAITDAAQSDDIAHGRALPTRLEVGVVARVTTPQGELLALARSDGERLHPFKVFTD